MWKVQNNDLKLEQFAYGYAAIASIDGVDELRTKLHDTLLSLMSVSGRISVRKTPGKVSAARSQLQTLDVNLYAQLADDFTKKEERSGTKEKFCDILRNTKCTDLVRCAIEFIQKN